MPRPAGASVETFELKGAALPPAVAAFINAINSSNLEGLMEAFAEDALVNDQLREFWGSSAIRDWADREVIGDRLSLALQLPICFEVRALSGSLVSSTPE
jgi:hypothetical protein